MIIGIVYIGLLVLGVGYAMFAGATGWLSDIGGADVHVDASGHLEAGHFHPVSGTTLATFITGFGGGGIVGRYLFGWGLVPGLALASVSGLLVAAAANRVLQVIFRQTQAGSEFTMSEMVGREAKVITTIPAGGTGEVVFVARGQREKSPARTSDGGPVPRGYPVLIDKVMGQTIYVRLKQKR